MGALYGFTLVFVRGGGRSAFIKSENNIRAERMLNLNRFFWCQTVLTTIEVRTKRDTLIINMHQTSMFPFRVCPRQVCVVLRCATNKFVNSLAICHAERKNLEATRVCHYRSVPIHKLV